MVRCAVAVAFAAAVSAPAMAQDWPPFVGAVQGALQKESVDLAAAEIEFFQGDALNQQCAGNPGFMEAARGLSAAVLYYTVAERSFRGLPVSGRLSYPHYLDEEPGSLLAGVDAVDLAAALGPDGPMALLPDVVSWVPAEMRGMARSGVGLLLETFGPFKTTLAQNPGMQQYALTIAADAYDAEPLYQGLGLPRNPDICYTLPFFLYLSVNGEETYVSLGALDHYAYTFWIRRMVEGSTQEAFALLQEAASQL